MIVEIPRCLSDDKYHKGTWTRFLAHTPEPEYRPYWSAMICCPECGRYLSLVLHSIDENGQVSPSVGHPAEYPPCTWHTSPKLLGWENWPLPPIPKLETCEICGIQSHSIAGWGTWSGGAGIICGKCFSARARPLPKGNLK